VKHTVIYTDKSTAKHNDSLEETCTQTQTHIPFKELGYHQRVGRRRIENGKRDFERDFLRADVRLEVSGVEQREGEPASERNGQRRREHGI
jgi:hypothetical protein